MARFLLRACVAVSALSIFASASSASSSTSSASSTSTDVSGPIETLGCYNAIPTDYTSKGAYTFQTSGYCQEECDSYPVMAITAGSTCYCGDELPSDDNEVDSDYCDTPCQGYSTQNCGGITYYQLYLTGEGAPGANAAEVDVSGSSSTSTASSTSSTSSSTSSTSSSSSTTTSTSSVASVVTESGSVVTVTASAASSTASATDSTSSSSSDSTSSSSSSSTSSSSGGGGSSSGTTKIGIAVGAVVGVVAVAAIVGGLLFWMKWRRRLAIEEEHRRNAAAAAASSAYIGIKSETSSTDQRLDPTFSQHRRNSLGSIADEQDFSRRILQVRNPDRDSRASNLA